MCVCVYPYIQYNISYKCYSFYHVQCSYAIHLYAPPLPST